MKRDALPYILPQGKASRVGTHHRDPSLCQRLGRISLLRVDGDATLDMDSVPVSVSCDPASIQVSRGW
jgi:hypothetical protein